MLIALGPGKPNIVALRVTGHVTVTDFARAAAEIDAAPVLYDTVNLYAEIEDLKGFRLEAFVKELASGVIRMKELSRFEKIAVVADRALIPDMPGPEANRLPGLEIRTFPLGEKDEALRWVSSQAPDRLF